MRNERTNKWMTKMPPDSPIYSTKWAGKTHASSTYTFFQIWDNTETNAEGTSWGTRSTSRIAQAPGACGPRLLCEACGALTSHPQALQGAWEGFERVLKQERAELMSWDPRNHSQNCGGKPALLWGRNLSSPGSFPCPSSLLHIIWNRLTISSHHLNFFYLELIWFNKAPLKCTFP